MGTILCIKRCVELCVTIVWYKCTYFQINDGRTLFKYDDKTAVQAQIEMFAAYLTNFMRTTLILLIVWLPLGGLV